MRRVLQMSQEAAGSRGSWNRQKEGPSPERLPVWHPPTEHVRHEYAYGQDGPTHVYGVLKLPQDRLDDFDNWLRAERARVWNEAKVALVEFYENPALPTPVNPYREEPHE